jgi:trimeric autotransporter adhesin
MVMNNVKFLMLIVAIVAAILNSAGCKKGGKVASMTMSPDTAIMAHGTMLQLNAITTLDDGSVFNFTQVVEWSSSDPNIADVDIIPGSKGIVTASPSTPGTVTITATDAVNHIMATATITVADPVSIRIEPAFPHMAIGTRHQFHAIASFLSSTLTQDITSSSTWTVLPLGIADVTSITTPGFLGRGIVTANTVNTAGPAANIEASFAAVAPGTTRLTVTDMAVSSITVTATPLSAGTATFTAKGQYPAGSTTLEQEFTSSVSWSSSDTAVATINDSGIATAVSVTGTTIITATDLVTNLSGTAELKVE